MNDFRNLKNKLARKIGSYIRNVFSQKKAFYILYFHWAEFVILRIKHLNIIVLQFQCYKLILCPLCSFAIESFTLLLPRVKKRVEIMENLFSTLEKRRCQHSNKRCFGLEHNFVEGEMLTDQIALCLMYIRINAYFLNNYE